MRWKCLAQVVKSQGGGEGKQIYKIYTNLEFDNPENGKVHQKVMMISGIYIVHSFLQ